MVGEGLRQLGFQVDEIEDGNDLLDRLGDAMLGVEDVHLPDLVIADLTLPGIKGYDALIAARNAGLDLPFILVTRLEAEPFREGFRQLSPGKTSECRRC
jgi:CheY-like chemotaxis protein